MAEMLIAILAALAFVRVRASTGASLATPVDHSRIHRQRIRPVRSIGTKT
jgi:hypothetical protein